MFKKMHHVGMVVPDMEAALQTYRALPGVEITEPVEVESLSLLIAYAAIGDNRFELLQPLSSDSNAAEFLTRNPNGGVNHVAYEVDDLIAARDTFFAQGIKTLFGGDEPREDSGGTALMVFDTRASHGTVIELRQSA